MHFEVECAQANKETQNRLDNYYKATRVARIKKHFEKNKTFYSIGIPVVLAIGGTFFYYKWVHLPALAQTAKIAEDSLRAQAIEGALNRALTVSEGKLNRDLAISEGRWNRGFMAAGMGIGAIGLCIVNPPLGALVVAKLTAATVAVGTAVGTVGTAATAASVAVGSAATAVTGASATTVATGLVGAAAGAAITVAVTAKK